MRVGGSGDRRQIDMTAQRLFDCIEGVEHRPQTCQLVAGELCKQRKPQTQRATGSQIASGDPQHAGGMLAIGQRPLHVATAQLQAVGDPFEHRENGRFALPVAEKREQVYRTENPPVDVVVNEGAMRAGSRAESASQNARAKPRIGWSDMGTMLQSWNGA